MPALNFQKQFADDVEAGKKAQTIRAKRKAAIRPGQILYLYTGLRTKYARKLREVSCSSVHRIIITTNGVVIYDGVGKPTIFTTRLWLDEFAEADGFANWMEMRGWFSNTHRGLPFEGVLIKWLKL